MTQALTSGPDTLADASGKLDSWKEIAAHLKRDVTTVQRWERREGLPVHRHVHDKRGSVYAYREEVDAWLLARGTSEHGRAHGDTAAAVQVTPALQMHPLSSQPAPIEATDQRRWPRLPASMIAALFTLVALVAVGVTVFALTSPRSGKASDAAPVIASLVVLPLVNLSGDESQDYLAASMTEELTTRLAQLGGLRVLSRTTAASLQHRKLSMRDLSRELDVDGVLEGAVRREGTRVHVSLQLIHAPADTHVWARTFDGEVAELPGVLTQIAHEAAGDLPVARR